MDKMSEEANYVPIGPSRPELPELPVNERDEEYGRIVSRVIMEWLMLEFGPASVPLGIANFTGHERLNCVAVGVHLQEWLQGPEKPQDALEAPGDPQVQG